MFINLSPPELDYWSLHCSPAMLDGEGLRYAHCNALESVGLSRSGKAYGFDLLRYGPSLQDSDALHVATACSSGVQFLIESALENHFIWHDPELKSRGATARATYVAAKNFFLWGNLSRTNRDFLDSLIWVPEYPLGPLAALATALSLETTL